jgi:hypothetical protein
VTHNRSKKAKKRNKSDVADVTATIRNHVLLIRMRMQEPKLSSTGKSIVVATTHGFRRVGVRLFGGREVYLSANACVYPDPTESEEEEDDNEENTE